MLNINVLLGKTLSAVRGLEKGSESVYFDCDSGDSYNMYHSQDCCEQVDIDDIVGDVADLLNSPILEAEEATNQDVARHQYDESFTWTFYKLSTIRGSVVIKWYGSSNGYYSEEVTFVQVGVDYENL